MNKRKQKRIFLGFSILAFLVSSATAIWTIWNTKDNKNFSEYEKLIQELKKEKNLVLSPEHKKKAEDFLNNPRYKNSSKENIEKIKKVIKEIKDQNNKENKEIIDLISKVKSDFKKKKLNAKLLNVKMSNDKQNIKDNVTKLIDIELAKNADLEKIEAKELIKRIKNSNKKKDFETKLASIKNLNDLGLLIDNVEKELENQSPNDYLSAKKEALKTKIAASSLEAKKKTNLTNLTNNSSDFSSLLDNEIKANIELIKDGLKKEIKDKIDRLKDNDFKRSVQNSLNKAKNIKDYYDILNKINEHEFNNKKADAIKSLDDLSDQDKKNDFIRELNNLTFAKPNANDELNRIINEINKLKHGQIDFIIDEVKKLPYPNGMDSIAIKDLTKKLDDIKSDNLSNLEKFNKANEIIGKNLDTYKSKINDAKDKISKLSPESAKKANEQLDQTSLLVRDANLPNHSFDELDQRIKDLLVQDKETAKSKINSIPDSKLTKKQKEDLVKLIDNTDTNDWAKITDIINKAEIDVAKKDLEDQAKLLNYPDGDKSKAIQSLINQINSNGNDKLDTKEKIEKFKKKLDSIKSGIDKARDLINTLDITKQNDLNKKLNDADTIEKLDSIIKEINDAIKVEQIKAIKDELDSYVDNLSYPSTNAPAKNEIKETYKNINDLNQLNQIKEKITNDTTGIESKIIKAKLEIDKLPKNEQSELNKVLDSANTDQEFVDLDKKIEAAKNKNKVENKKTIDALNDLPEELKNRLKDEIDNALTSKEITRIKNKAELLAKIEQLKKVITPNDYALANDDDVKKIINETISKLKTSIDGIEENQVQAKKTELDGLKSKLVELKKEIEGLEEKDVLDASKTKKDLAIQLAQDINDESIEDTKLFIKKARLKKKVSELDYPNKQNVLAIDKLNTRINDATKDNVNEIETLIKNLPNKILEAKNLINGVNKNNNNAEDVRRRQDLTEQLNRTVTDEEFEQLKKNIESAKTQSTEEYNNALKDRLKQQVNALEYPIPSSQSEAEAKKKLINKIDTLKQSDLETFDDTIDKIGKKIAEAKNKISKLSPSKADSGILETSKTSELSDFDKLLQKLDQLRNEDRNEINKKIEELNELTLEEKTKYKNDVNLADSYSDMLNVLKKARDKHLEKIVDKLPYPTNNGRARSMLKKSIIDANTNNDNTFNAKVKSFEQIKKLIIDAKTRIEQLPYSKQNTPGRKFLNDKLDEATTETEIKEIANDDLKQKIQKYKELIQKVGDFTLPKPNQNNLINGRLDHLPDTNENDLKKQIYETKRQQVALREINKLSNIKQKDKKDKLKNDIVAWNPTVDNNLSIDDFIKKVNDVDKKIIDAYKEDLKAKVDALPYPNPNSNEAQTAKNTLKSEIEKLSTKAKSNDEYAKLNNLISKIKELKNKALSIVNANEKIEVEKLINGLDNENKVANIELAILKAKAKDTIDTIVNLSDTEKNSLKSEVANAQNNDQINNIVSKARKLGEFNRRKNAIKKIIDSIPYPRQNSTMAEKSIKSLKDQVDALIDDTTKINELEKKINDLKASVETLVENANNIDYIKNDAHKPLEALNKIKEKIDGLTDASKVSDVLPNDYANKIFKYKDIINKAFKDANIKNELLTKLNKAVPNNYDGDYKLSNLDSDLLAKLKEQAIAKINNMSNLDEAKRNVHKAKVNSVNSSNDLNKYQTTVIDVIDNFVIEGYKENYNIFIDKLPYPSDDENNAASLRTKTALKNTHVKNINKSTNIQNLEKTLNDFATKVKAVQSSIAGISNTNDQNKTAIKNFNKQFAGFGQGTKLDNLKKLVDNYKTISAEFNKFIPYTGSPAEDVKAANKSLEALKIKLWDELAKIGSKALQDQLVGIINENLELYKKSKTLFSGDILVATNFLDESLNLLNTKKDKTTVADVRTIINKMQPYKDELNRFWTKEKGDYLRGRKDQWFNSIPQNTPNPINVDQFKFLTYDLLIKKLRSRKTAAEVKKIVDYEVEQYKALHRFKLAYDNQQSSQIPQNVKDSLKNKILNVPANVAITEMDEITKYLGQRTESNGNVTSGFYLDAKHLLESLNNSIDNESDKKHFKTLFDNIGVVNSGQSYDENVTQKIDNFRKEIKDFISKLSDANAKKKIEDIINQIKDQAEKQKLLDKLKKKNISIRELESIKNDANKQKEKELSEAKEEAKKIIDQIGYPGGKNSNAITTLKHQVDNAKSVDDIARLNENNKKIKEAVKRALDAIDKLTDEMTKKNLKSELDSTISIDGENSGIKYITGKAIMKHREALEKKKIDIQKSIEKQKDSADKKDLLSQLKHIESEKDLDMVKQQLSLIQKKDGLKDEVSKLALFDLSGHLNENGSRGRGGLNSSQLSMLNKRISDATTEQALNLIKNDINKQKDAELVDLALDETNGGIRIDSLNGETTYTDFSEMKKFLFDIIFGIKTIKNDANQYERNKFETENQKLQNKIKYQTKTVEQYRQVKKEAEEFVKKWEGGVTRSWEQFFIERIEKHSNETPKEAGPFPVNVQSELIEAIKSKLRNKGTSREQAIILENEYLKKTFFDARRLKKLNYDYLQFIKDLKLNPWLDDNEKSLLDLQYKKFESAPTVREKEAIALNIDPKLVGAGIDINNSWRSSSQVEFVDWWITKIVESSESVISQENKYIWIDKIALTIDEEKSVAVKLWNDSRKQYPRLLDGTILNRDGFPERNAPFFLGN